MEKREPEIRREIIAFIVEKLYKEKSIIAMTDIAFFGEPLYFTAKDMLYLFYFIESKWNISLEKSDVDNPYFYTLSGLTQIIRSKLE